MVTHLNASLINPTSSNISAPPLRAPSLSPERSGEAGDAPPSKPGASASKVKAIKKNLTLAIKTCTEGIKENKDNETIYLQRLDNIDCCEEDGYTKAIELAKQLIGCKKKAIEIYDAAINKLVGISETVASGEITLGPEQNKKLDQLPQ